VEFTHSGAERAGNDRFLANVILRHEVPKNLVPRSKKPFVRRTRCFTSFSMTYICYSRVFGSEGTKDLNLRASKEEIASPMARNDISLDDGDQTSAVLHT
jgi:hypothetical protein